jgi:hypothetical protein
MLLVDCGVGNKPGAENINPVVEDAARLKKFLLFK